jgi:Undecaprenyl-phosphate glucose phosphotransferase
MLAKRDDYPPSAIDLIPIPPTENAQTPASVLAALRTDSRPSKPTRHTTLSVVLTAFVAIEFLAVAVSAYLSALIYYRIVFNSWLAPLEYVTAAVYIAILNLFIANLFRHYVGIQKQPRHVFLWRGLGAIGLSLSLFISTIFLLKIAGDYSRGSFIFQVIGVGSTILVARTILYSWLHSLIAAGLLEAQRVILIGDAMRCSQFADRLKASGIQTASSFRFPICRDNKSAKDGNGTTSTNGDVHNMVEACRSLLPDDIIVLPDGEDLAAITDLANSLSVIPANFHIVPIGAFGLLETARIVEFGNLQTIKLYDSPLSLFDRVVKRTFDICAAIAGLIILSPLFLVVSIAIKLDSRGPIFFRQTRHGFNNAPIRILKFRSMTTTEDGDEFRQATMNDARVTRVGRILRYTSIDELPQLVNVLCGEMSIVGPRPHPIALNNAFKEKISPFARRHTVKPGITGWAQVNGFRGPTDTLEKMSQRIEHDIYYVDHWSFLFDMKIVMMTLVAKNSYTNAY